MKKKLIVFLSCVSLIFIIAMMPGKPDVRKRYHTAEQLAHLPPNTNAILDTSNYFLHPYDCMGCHGHDALGLANIDLNGNDVNLFDDWETSMMGLAGKDPFWRAKVEQEIIINPAHSNELQNFCTDCHAPMGNFTARFHGAQHYLLSDLDQDSLGQAGVACGGCHSIASDSLVPVEFSGKIHYDTSGVEYGPFQAPDFGPMQLYVGIIPTYSTHVSRSTMCASCHTLISNTVDLSGNPTGTSFVEQSTYQEWVNSVYPTQDRTCQTCHMPAIEDPIQIANGNINQTPRSPFNLHQFAGANSFMVGLIKAHKDSLSVDAPDANFDSTLSAINVQLTQNTLKIETDTEGMSLDTLFLGVKLTNKAGHKFPSGYPSRRAVLQVVALKDNGDTLFSSGLFDANHEVKYLDNPFESHYNIIRDSHDAQIYEMILGDVNGNRTTILERAFSKLKDNRIPPKGFSTTHYNYDTCNIVGGAATDPDFNKTSAGTEGTGTDMVHYHIALNGYHGHVNVKTKVVYQTIPPFWLNEMRTVSHPRISKFLTMFDAADNTPIFVASDSLMDIELPTGMYSSNTDDALHIFPNPSNDGKVFIRFGKNNKAEEILIYNSNMQLCSSNSIHIGSQNISVLLPETKGLYFIRIRSSNGNILKKIIRN